MSDWRDAFIKKAKIQSCPHCGAAGKGDIDVFEEPIVVWGRPGGELKAAIGMEQALPIRLTHTPTTCSGRHSPE